MVDLDQTLIHTTEQHCPQMSNKVSDSSFSLGGSHKSVHFQVHSLVLSEFLGTLYVGGRSVSCCGQTSHSCVWAGPGGTGSALSLPVGISFCVRLAHTY